jgi:hypothetical protein
MSSADVAETHVQVRGAWYADLFRLELMGYAFRDGDIA